ncbi:hypothetical protein, partial [Yersinia pekkanenii]|uniref:hypothetical protein n=1 Tax=Yersinia pekkanenii TaxID=1288385 RepID=UPI001AE0317A
RILRGPDYLLKGSTNSFRAGSSSYPIPCGVSRTGITLHFLGGCRPVAGYRRKATRQKKDLKSIK